MGYEILGPLESVRSTSKTVVALDHTVLSEFYRSAHRPAEASYLTMNLSDP
jgi:hypothetical protein